MNARFALMTALIAAVGFVFALSPAHAQCGKHIMFPEVADEIEVRMIRDASGVAQLLMVIEIPRSIQINQSGGGSGTPGPNQHWVHTCYCDPPTCDVEDSIGAGAGNDEYLVNAVPGGCDWHGLPDDPDCQDLTPHAPGCP
ncbi:hypothetical protein IT575_00990 [bacterium]|nr:hypothetical protein [bacterium]